MFLDISVLSWDSVLSQWVQGPLKYSNHINFLSNHHRYPSNHLKYSSNSLATFHNDNMITIATIIRTVAASCHFNIDNLEFWHSQQRFRKSQDMNSYIYCIQIAYYPCSWTVPSFPQNKPLLADSMQPQSKAVPLLRSSLPALSASPLGETLWSPLVRLPLVRQQAVCKYAGRRQVG